MSRLLITRREFKDDEEKNYLKSSVKYPGVLMVKKPEDRNYIVYIVASDYVSIFLPMLTIGQFLLRYTTEMLFYHITRNSMSVGYLGDSKEVQSARERGTIMKLSACSAASIAFRHDFIVYKSTHFELMLSFWALFLQGIIKMGPLALHELIYSNKS